MNWIGPWSLLHSPKPYSVVPFKKKLRAIWVTCRQRTTSAAVVESHS